MTTPVKVKKLGHVVLTVSDIERTVKFWTEIMGFKYPTAMSKAWSFSAMGRIIIPSLSCRPKHLMNYPKRVVPGFTIAPWR